MVELGHGCGGVTMDGSVSQNHKYATASSNFLSGLLSCMCMCALSIESDRFFETSKTFIECFLLNHRHART